MQNEIVPLVIFIAIGFGAGYWFFARSIRQFQETAQRQLESTAQEMRVEMKMLVDATQQALVQTQEGAVALRQALARPSEQGQWGEMLLERIVELSGMGSYCRFQPELMVNGVKQRPDLVVDLSNGRSIIVDTKAPVDAYTQVYEAPDHPTRVARLRHYAEQVRKNMQNLAKKDYWKLMEPSPAWVVMLLPHEAMFSAALEADATLLDSAIQQHVLLASPITLLALLKAMSYGWQQEKRAGNVQQIIEQSQILHTELRNFLTQWKKLRGELSGTTTAFNQCMATYQTEIFPAVQRICELDGTGSAAAYDMSGISKLRGPKQVLDFSIEEESGQEESKPKGSNKKRKEKKPESDGEQDSRSPDIQALYAQVDEEVRALIAQLPDVEKELETEELIVPVVDYRSLPLSELQQIRETESVTERFRRAVDAIMAYNMSVDVPELRWFINPAAVIHLVGGRTPIVKSYLDSRWAEIEAHHRKYRLSSRDNRSKAVSITERITVEDVPGAESDLSSLELT